MRNGLQLKWAGCKLPQRESKWTKKRSFKNTDMKTNTESKGREERDQLGGPSAKKSSKDRIGEVKAKKGQKNGPQNLRFS